MASIQNMTSGRPGRLIFSFALPLMIGNLFQQFYTVTDTMIVGQVLGVGALAAVGATDWLVWMMLGVAQGCSQGFSIWMAQEFGAGHPKKLRNVVANSIFLTAVIALVMLVLGQLAALPILRLLHTPDAVIPDALRYMSTIFWGIPVTAAYNLLAAILRALGDGRTPLHAMVFAAITNIGLDLLFVAGLGMGVASAAAATVIAQLLAGLFCYFRIRRIEILHLTREDLTLYRPVCLHLLELGFPIASQNTLISVGGIVVQSVVNRYGVSFLAGFTATNKLYGMLEVAASSYGYAMTTYSGQNLGAGRIDRIRQGYRAALGIAVVTSLLITAVMVFGGRSILSLFITGDKGLAADALAIAYYYLFVMSVCLPILYYLHVTRSCIQGLGNTVLPMVSGLLEFIMRTSSVLLLPLFMGSGGIFYAEPLAWIGADTVLCISYFYCMGKVRRQFEKD